MNSTSKPITECQICGASDLESIFFFGYLPPVNTMPALGTVPVEQAGYPLELLRCRACTLVQIGLEVDPKILFPEEYPYLSGSTRILRENFKDLYAKVRRKIKLGADDLVVDIGSNDGTLLGNFKDGGHQVLGVEPSDASKVALAKGIRTRVDFFNASVARWVREQYGKATVVTAANVFAHIGGIHSVVDGIVDLLAPKGIFVSESHYLLGLLKTVQYDTVYHEHLRYYSLLSLSRLLESHNLQVIDVEDIPTHGGSIRVYAAHRGAYRVSPSVKRVLDREKREGLTDGRIFDAFRRRVIQSKLDLYALLKKVKTSPKVKIYGIGAPSRASTLINFVGLDNGILDAVMEIKTSPKVGKYIPGTRIPVLDEAKLYEDQPAYALLLSWHIGDELVKILRKNGFKGKFITPLPTPRLIR